MFNDNPFRDIKTNPILPITEGAVDKAADHFDVEVSEDGKTWQHHSGKGPKYTSDELIKKYSEHLKSIKEEIELNEDTVMDLIEKRKSHDQQDASLMLRQGASYKEVKDTIGRKRTPEGKSGNALLRKAWRDSEVPTIIHGRSNDYTDEPLPPRIQKHNASRGVPTTLARKAAQVKKPVKEEVELNEGWNDRLESVTGFTWIDKDHPMYKPKHDPKNTGSHYHNHNTGEGMSEAKVFKLYDRMMKNTDDLYTGLNPTGDGVDRPQKISTIVASTDLFPKNWQINLREHIRNEYSDRGYDATTVEVQETFNHVISMLNERHQGNKERSRVGEIERGQKVLGRNFGFESDAIEAERNTRDGLVISPEARANVFALGPVVDDATRIRRSIHIAKRNKLTKVSPSSPARPISDTERKTRRGT